MANVLDPSGDQRSAWIRILPLSALPQTAENSHDWLSSLELARLSAISTQRRRRQFLAGHWLARDMAAEHCGGSFASWDVVSADGGAPHLKLLDCSLPAVSLSLSHSGDWVAAAIATYPVGIDLECPSKPRDLLALADMTFSPEERAELRELSENGRASAFYLYWTLKEATGKREGHGLRPELARRQRPVACAANEAEVVSWQFADCSLALAGETGMSVRTTGLPEAAFSRYWRIEPVTL